MVRVAASRPMAARATSRQSLGQIARRDDTQNTHGRPAPMAPGVTIVLAEAARREVERVAALSEECGPSRRRRAQRLPSSSKEIFALMR
jgi:hypothetical protein